MFWIGLIVGAIVGTIGLVALIVLYGLKYFNMSWNEAAAMSSIYHEAGHNRESTITLTHNGEVLDELTLEEE